ncbi:MAG TPA: hypothetical protein VE988_28740 [Gemmataceae bacterium]|nr:hypothetical protein [Gemmataceae bacterium]
MPRLHQISLPLSCVCLLLFSGAARAQTLAEAEKGIEDLQQNGQLFDKTKHKEVRAAFAKLFEAKHQKTIAKSFGDDAEAITKWLDARPDFRDHLFSAINDHYDRVGPAMSMFRQLWKYSPEKVASNPELAIAVVVSWDEPERLYHYERHQERTKSSLPNGQIDGLGNFQYIINDKVLEARCRWLPWEFLVFVVDHTTPLAERAWAQTYARTNAGLTSWHKDVPYDHGMLKAEKSKGTSAVQPKLAGQEYTLANIRAFGGVCAMQADFAARVAKSTGVPAVYCGGQSANGVRHAWWMWVQVTKVTADSLQFTLKSDGRFQGFIKDAFYTGLVEEPRRGTRILDREMERRLYVAGNDRVGNRQAEMLMNAYVWLQRKQKWDTAQKREYLDKVRKLCPLHEGPWLEYAKMAQVNKSDQDKEALGKYVPVLLEQFKNFPDFVQENFKYLVTTQPAAEQLKSFQKALILLDKSGRPDLVCAGVLELTDARIKQQDWLTAFKGLHQIISRYPTEGRFIPRLTKKAQEVAGQIKGGNDQLGLIYLDLVPKIAVYYRGEGATYPDEIYNQAMGFFAQNKMDNYANALRGAMKK